MGREKFGVAKDLAAAAGWNFEDIHVKADLGVPGEETLVVVDLRAS